MFADDGSVPNNPPAVCALSPRDRILIGSPDPEDVIENGSAQRWRDMWRNGIFPYVHYHFDDPRGMGIARGPRQGPLRRQQGPGARSQHGVRLRELPAGTGHQCLSASPESDGDRHLFRRTASTISAAAARANMPRRWKPSRVPLPDSDPVFRQAGPLLRLWHN